MELSTPPLETGPPPAQLGARTPWVGLVGVTLAPGHSRLVARHAAPRRARAPFLGKLRQLDARVQGAGRRRHYDHRKRADLDGPVARGWTAATDLARVALRARATSAPASWSIVSGATNADALPPGSSPAAGFRVNQEDRVRVDREVIRTPNP